MSQWHSSTVSDMSQLFTVPCHSAGRSQQNSLNVLYDAIYQVCVCHVTVPHIGSIFWYWLTLVQVCCFCLPMSRLCCFWFNFLSCRHCVLSYGELAEHDNSAACIRHAIMMDLHACHHGICCMARALRNSHAATLFAFQQCTLA